MSRNKEKAQSSLNRFYQSQSSAPINYHYHQRPKNIHSITQLSQAEGWRRSIIGEISKQLTEINDFEISDIKIRELNDQLNELFNEKDDGNIIYEINYMVMIIFDIMVILRII